MRIEFSGDPWETLDRGGLVIRARADGRPFFCVVTREAFDLATRTLWLGVTSHSAVFQQYSARFQEALALKLLGYRQLPMAAVITTDDLRQVR